MACHETKHCSRCSLPFECKVGNITQCQCYGITFTDAEKAYIDKRYADCLCRVCLLAAKREVTYNPIKNKMKQILSIFKPR